MIFTFDEKIMALATIRSVGERRTTIIFSRMKRIPSPTMREELQNMYHSHYLLSDSLIEVTSAGVLNITELTCPQQPVILTKEYFDSCKEEKQEEINNAFSVLRCTALCKNLKPYPIVKKEVRYAKNKT